MTSCLLVPAVHLRAKYGTFMVLHDAFYGFVMEFPAAFKEASIFITSLVV